MWARHISVSDRVDLTVSWRSYHSLRNQENFVPAAWNALKSTCQNGTLGPAEMLLFYAFRGAEGSVISGV
jgi:hypothetical protein